MRRLDAPALPGAMAILAGAWVGLDHPEAGVAVGIAVAALGLVLGPVRPLLVSLATGYLLAVVSPRPWLDPAALGAGIDPTRPVEVVGRPVGEWRRASGGWRAGFAARTLRQRGTVAVRATLVQLYVAGEGPPPEGGRFYGKGRLRPPRPARNGPRSPPGRWSVSIESRRLLERLDRSRGSRWLLAARRGADQALSRHATPAAALAKALLLGRADELPLAWLLTLRRLGLGHLVAVSGLHVGLVAGLVWLLLSWLPPAMRWAPMGGAVAAYLLLVGPRPSLLRAVAMSLLALASLTLERRPAVLNAWSVAAAGMVVWRPTVLLDLGYQLTAAATLGLICLTPALAHRWRSVLPRGLALGLAASVSAHLATLPWSVAVFHLWSPGAIFLNLIAVPWTACTLGVATAVLLLGWVPAIGTWLWSLLECVAAPYGWLASLPVDGWTSVATSLSAPVLVVIAAWMGWSLLRGRLPAVAAAALASGCILVRGDAAAASGSRDAVEAVMLDVGQGSALLLRDGERAVLVDGGGWRSPGIATWVLLPALVERGVRRLEAVVMSHPDQDHCGGLEELVHLLPVAELWSGVGWDAPCYRRLVGTPGIRLRPLWRGVRRRVGDWRLEVLHPPPGDHRSGNERSLVMRAEAGGTSLLLTGDIGFESERRLEAAPEAELRATFLELAHHGSRYSSEAGFLDRVGPRAALVSVGAGNVYGHPSDEVVKRLEERRIALFRTDRGGQVVIRRSAGGGWTISQPWAPRSLRRLP